MSGSTQRSAGRSPGKGAIAAHNRLCRRLANLEVTLDAIKQDLWDWIMMLATAKAPVPGSGTRPRSPRGLPPVVDAIEVTHLGDGSVDVTFHGPSLDGPPVVHLRPRLGQLFEILSADKGKQRKQDGYVPFKSRSYIKGQVRAGRASRPLTDGALNQALSVLRQELDKRLLNGAALVQCHRGEGWRIALRRDLAA